jgi:hypothetical protein
LIHEGLQSIPGAKTAGKVQKKAANAYSSVDDMNRMVIFVNEIRKGKTDAQAAAIARKYMLDYTNLPPIARLLRAYGMPFIAFPWKFIPMVPEMVAKHPFKVLKYEEMFRQFGDISQKMSTMSEKEFDRAGNLVDKIRETPIGESHLMRSMHVAPFGLTPDQTEKGRKGNFYALDKRYIFPLAEYFTPVDSEGYLPNLLQPSHPLYSIAYVMVTGQDPYFGYSINDKNDSTEERMWNIAAYVWRTLSPSSPFVPGSYQYEKLKSSVDKSHIWNVRRKYTQDSLLAIMDVFLGIKIKEYSTNKETKRLSNEFLSYRRSIEKEAQEIAQQYPDQNDPVRKQKLDELYRKLANERNEFTEKASLGGDVDDER